MFLFPNIFFWRLYGNEIFFSIEPLCNNLRDTFRLYNLNIYIQFIHFYVFDYLFLLWHQSGVSYSLHYFQNRDPLLGEPWYFKSLKDRKTGDRLLRKVGKVPHDDYLAINFASSYIIPPYQSKNRILMRTMYFRMERFWFGRVPNRDTCSPTQWWYSIKTTSTT